MQEQKPYLTDVDLAARYGVTRVTIWRWRNSENLPQPLRLGPNTVRWSRESIERWEAEQAEQAGGAAA